MEQPLFSIQTQARRICGMQDNILSSVHQVDEAKQTTTTTTTKNPREKREKHATGN
jgi:hypothetical protein